jgi:hypothetical protein
VEAAATTTGIVVLEARTAAPAAVRAAKAASQVWVAALEARTRAPAASRAAKAVFPVWVAVPATASQSPSTRCNVVQVGPQRRASKIL